MFLTKTGNLSGREANSVMRLVPLTGKRRVNSGSGCIQTGFGPEGIHMDGSSIADHLLKRGKAAG